MDISIKNVIGIPIAIIVAILAIGIIGKFFVKHK